MYKTDILIKELELADRANSHIILKYIIVSNLLEDEDKLVEFIVSKEYERIGIYGSGVVGRVLLDLLEPHCGNIIVIDRDKNTKFIKNVPVYTPNEIKGRLLDVVIITPVNAYDKIKESLHSIGITNCISVSDITLKQTVGCGLCKKI